MGAPYTVNLRLPREVYDTGITDASTYNAAMDLLDDLLAESLSWKAAVTSFGDLPVGQSLGEARVVIDELKIYLWDGVAWKETSEGALVYQGTWNASTNTPVLADGTGIVGHYYVVSVGGSQDLGSGLIVFSPGDWVVHNGTIWQKADHTDVVTSVFTRQGAVVAQSGDYTHAQIGSVGADDHHAQVHTHASHTGIGIDDHHARDHRVSHILGGADAFQAADLLDALIRRVRESGGPTDLLVGSIPDGAGLRRSGASIIGDPGVSFRCWDVAFGSATAAGFNSGSTTPTVMRIKTFPGTDIMGIPIRACCMAMSSSGNAGYVEIYRPSNGTVILTLGPITATTPTLYSALPPWTNPWPTTEEPLHIRIYRGVGAASITAYDFSAGVY